MKIKFKIIVGFIGSFCLVLVIWEFEKVDMMYFIDWKVEK